MFWCSGNVTTDSFAFRSHTLAVLSRPAVTRYLPSARERHARAPSRRGSRRSAPASPWSTPADRSQTRTARSHPPAASVLPSGETARHSTESSASSRCLTITFVSFTPSRISTPSSVLPLAVEVVDADVALLPGPAAGDRELAVGQERHRVGPLGPGVDALHELAVGHVPDGQFVVPADDEVLVVRGEGEGVDDGRERVRLRRRRRLPPHPQLLDEVGLRVEPGVELRPLLDPLRDDRGLVLRAPPRPCRGAASAARRW